MKEVPEYGRDPLASPRRLTIAVGNSEATVPVLPEVADTIQRWAHDHIDALAEALRPHNLHPHDIAAPRYEHYVYADQVAQQQ